MPWTKDECSPIRLQRNKRPLNEKMQSRLNRLIEMGIVEHIGRKKYVLDRSLYAATGKLACIQGMSAWIEIPTRNCW